MGCSCRGFDGHVWLLTCSLALHRVLVDRALAQQRKVHKVKFLFKKLLSVETRIGDEAGQDRAKAKAREWVAQNAQSQE